MSEKINLNIQPQASIYALFSRLSYNEWYALAEFVDNSTASYYAHKDELLASHFDKLVVEINYDPLTDTITIEDNAFGMELNDFKRAILLDAKPIIKGRNEFGYGLKTAATWFGNHWSVESTQLDSENCYSATIDIDDLVSSKKNNTEINVSPANYNDHYTKITITKLNRKLNTSTIKKKIIEVLNSMYRRDLKDGLIEIIYNGTILSFKDYPILNFRGVDWKKDISISFDYAGKIYKATGFVGIMDVGGYEKTGFALFRNNRAIECNFKPEQIFGRQAQTQISLKLFGELDMDSFEVNQAKDGFSWNSELKELFVENLKNSILDYIEVAKMSKKDRELEESSNNSANKTPNQNQGKDLSNPENNNYNNSSNGNSSNNTDNESQTSNATDNSGGTSKSNFNNDLLYNFKIKLSLTEYDVEWTDKLPNKFLYTFSSEKLMINLNHEFIKSINSNEERLAVSKIILAYFLAEEKAKESSTTNGYVKASVIHNKIDSILSSIK